MNKRDLCENSQYLPQLVAERLPHDKQTQLEDHLETCEECQQALDLLVDGDELAEKTGMHLRQPTLGTDQALSDAMERLRSVVGATCSNIAEAPESLDQAAQCPLADFAVDYLQPSDNAHALGRLGPYEISEVLGSGGMGIVLKGHDAKLNRIVAIKVLSPAFATHPTARKRFVREAQAAAAIGHPHVVTIYSVGEDRLPYLVMEYIDGPTLQERLETEGFLQLNQILRIGVQVASGLAAAHAQGLVHRDIKPGNILLERGIERATLTDFGLARAAGDATVTQEGTVVGTPQYMSPEQAQGEAVDPLSDLFSLGSVLYTLATGRPPFRAETTYGVLRKITDANPKPIRELNPDIPEWLCAIIEKLMEKEKAARIQSASELAQLLESCLSHTQQPTAIALPQVSTLLRSHTLRFSRYSKIAIGITAMLAITICLSLAFGGPFSLTDKTQNETSTASQQQPSRMSYKTEFVLTFSDANEIGTLNVDIKRGSIDVMGYDGDEIIVELTVPNYQPAPQQPSSGLREIQSSNLDFDIEKSPEQIKVDGNSYKYITNLKIKVPRKTNLILDSYRDGLVQVQQVEGSFDVRSHHSDIRLKNISGSAQAWSYNGSLVADFVAVAEDQRLSFESYNGSIDIALPADIKADLKYRTHGKVLTDFDVTPSAAIQATGDGEYTFDEFLRGALNGGGPTLLLETEKGDIRLQKRMTNLKH